MNKKELYENMLMEYSLTSSGISIKELEIRAKALENYIEQRKMCEPICGGVENDSNI